MSHRSEPTCPCGRPVDGTTLCRGCVKTLAWALANIAGDHADLDTLRTRQTRYHDPAPLRSGGGPIPLPVDHRFTDPQGADTHSHQHWGAGTDLDWVTRNTITTWVRIVLEHHPHLPGPRRDTIGSCCAWLMTHASRIAVADYGPDLLDELCHLEKQLARFVDRPPDRWYAGPCTAGLSGLAGTWLCGTDLYAAHGDTEVTCRDCNTTYPVEHRRAWLLAHAEDEWHTATAIARAVVVWTDYDRGETRLVRRISDWTRRSRIEVRDHQLIDGRHRPRYRLGDVLDLLTEDACGTDVLRSA